MNSRAAEYQREERVEACPPSSLTLVSAAPSLTLFSSQFPAEFLPFLKYVLPAPLWLLGSAVPYDVSVAAT